MYTEDVKFCCVGLHGKGDVKMFNKVEMSMTG